MLTELRVQNLGVIERASLVLGSGMTALTGDLAHAILSHLPERASLIIHAS